VSERVKKVHPWYNFDKLFSHNCVFNFVPGARGIGKTYGAKKFGIRAAIARGEQFIYLRRYEKELKASKQTFMDDLKANAEFEDYDFRINANRVEFSSVDFRDDKKREWKIAGYFLSLSTQQSQKSVAFPAVTLIIFDEFIIEKGAVHYLPNEADVFQNFFLTVDRFQDKTRVLFLANAVSIMNPYFLAYDIKPEKDTEWIKLADGFIVVHFPKSDAFASSISATRFGKFIKDTDYSNYAVNNGFADNTEQLLQMKSGKARYRFTVETGKGSFSVWHDVMNNVWYAQERQPKNAIVFVTDPARMDEGKRLALRSDKLMQVLRSAFTLGRLYFDNPKTRNSMIEIFKG